MSAHDRWKTNEAEIGDPGPDSESYAAGRPLGNDQRIELASAWPAEEMEDCDGSCRAYFGAETHAQAHRIARLVEQLTTMLTGGADAESVAASDSQRRLGGGDPADELLEALAIALDTVAQVFETDPGRRRALELVSGKIEVARMQLTNGEEHG